MAGLKKEVDANGPAPADADNSTPQQPLAPSGKVVDSSGNMGDIGGSTVLTKSGEQSVEEAIRVFPTPNSAGNAPDKIGKPAPATEQTTAPDTRKLIRNAQLDLEVKSFQAAMDRITALTKAAGGYVDTSNSQKGW